MSVYDIDRIAVPDAPPDYEDDTRDRHYVPAPCQVACPVGTDAPSYIGPTANPLLRIGHRLTLRYSTPLEKDLPSTTVVSRPS